MRLLTPAQRALVSVICTGITTVALEPTVKATETGHGQAPAAAPLPLRSGTRRARGQGLLEGELQLSSRGRGPGPQQGLRKSTPPDPVALRRGSLDALPLNKGKDGSSTPPMAR